MTLPITFCVVLLLAAFATGKNSLHPLSDEFISLINSKQSSWKAGRNFSPNTPRAYIKKLMGVLNDTFLFSLPIKKHDADLIDSLPDNFDPSERWPNCESLKEIGDQGSCGSCWAFGAVEAMTDRVCTFSNGTKKIRISAEDLLSCCVDCGYGCNGGFPSKAWYYWQHTGIVSGGPYNSSQGCRPYEIPPCKHITEGNRPKCELPSKTPQCVRKCEAGYNLEYNQDKHHAKRVYSVGGEDHIKAELYSNGPVEATFTVFEDFLHYKSGVYSHTYGILLGYHAIKILSWGVENGKEYWLCANSWNSDWGDKGFFKILRGVNECDIEKEVLAGEPDLNGL